jgi:nucleotide-binding universal stress UspA family protein
MIKKFIITTDLSPVSYAIVNCIGSLRDFGASECLLLQCLSRQEMASLALSYTTAPLENMLHEQRQTLEKHGFTVTTRIVSSNVKQEVNHIAEKDNYSLIVLGFSRSTVRDTFLGGIAYNVIHHARKPTLVVPVETKDYDDVCTRFVDLGKHILYPTDFSENADLAFSFVEGFVGCGAKHVTLLHVQDKPRLDPYLKDRIEEFNRIDRERLEQLGESLKKRGNPIIDVELAYGSPYTEIMQLIRTRDISLVLMGSQGRGFIQELFLGSVSHNVVQNSETPVMLIPAKR